MLALTSLTIEEFEDLLITFSEVWISTMNHFNFDGSERKRAYSEKKNAVLKLIEDKLFFILYFLKNNPLQETLAVNFGMDQPQANVYIHLH